MIVGKAPEILGQFRIECEPMLFYQYLPIKMAGDMLPRIPPDLLCFQPLVDAIDYSIDDYVYLTAKKLFVGPKNLPNRPGWHLDGFLTDDINYIWYDCIPTEICIQEIDVVEDHDYSLKELQRQANLDNVVKYPPYTLIKLDQYVIHRPSIPIKEQFRTFAKISVSKDKYNLKGNAHNHLFDYKWEMYDRLPERNHPIVK